MRLGKPVGELVHCLVGHRGCAVHECRSRNVPRRCCLCRGDGNASVEFGRVDLRFSVSPSVAAAPRLEGFIRDVAPESAKLMLEVRRESSVANDGGALPRTQVVVCVMTFEDALVDRDEAGSNVKEECVHRWVLPHGRACQPIAE